MTTPINPFTGIITDDMKDMFNDAIDALLESQCCGRTCRLIYEGSKATPCPNCYQINGPNGVQSNNKYRPGGPVFFAFGICPYCNGRGYRLDQETQDITAIV